uniref:Gst16 n=1 Tax=Arundo donax TaxID=35708 RepID=A0A0A9G0F7_ARUDO
MAALSRTSFPRRKGYP